MAEDLMPTVIPGMVGLKHKKTGRISQHFPVDAREILSISRGEYDIVDNGAAQAARMNANPLHALQADSKLIHSEVTGVEGQVLVAMTPEQAEAWKKQSDVSGTKDVTTAAEDAEAAAPPKEPAKEPAKPASGSAKTADTK